MELKDKVVLITGAGKGAGRALARALAERGAFIAANDISPINVEQLVAQILANGGKAKAYIDDVAKKVGVQSLIHDVEDDLGKIDILINNRRIPHDAIGGTHDAGIVCAGGKRSRGDPEYRRRSRRRVESRSGGLYRKQGRAGSAIPSG